MADEKKEYRRKISDEEAQGQFILVLKNALDFFPKVGETFKVVINDEKESKEHEFNVMLNSFQRWSVGPNKPQNHYTARSVQNLLEHCLE